jgi:drug/metabolite transporter (DMT)-like permease
MRQSIHTKAVLQALLVTFLWSTSWVFIEIGLEDVPALTFAGLRYTLGFLCLLPLALRSPHRGKVRQLSRKSWLQLILLGISFYPLAQGAQYLGLFYLPTVMANLLLSFGGIFVVVLGFFTLGERPTRQQVVGIGLYLLGVLVYFYPVAVKQDQALGILIVLGGVLANTVASLLGRAINREAYLPPLLVTAISMGIGAAILITVGLLAEGLPSLSLVNIGIICWLAVVNTAFAFVLWNHTLQILSALESTIINNAMMIQIPILALIFLGADIQAKEALGMLIAGLGILAVQLRGAKVLPPPETFEEAQAEGRVS